MRKAPRSVTDKLGKELDARPARARAKRDCEPDPAQRAAPGLSLVVSNVRGPDVPLYMAGAQLVKYAPISIAVDGMGLNVTGFSYAGILRLCAVSCREMLPDPAFLRRLPARFLPEDEGSGRTRSALRLRRARPPSIRRRDRAAACKGGKKSGATRQTRIKRATRGKPNRRRSRRLDVPGSTARHGGPRSRKPDAGSRGGRPVGGERWSTANVACVHAIACRTVCGSR